MFNLIIWFLFEVQETEHYRLADTFPWSEKCANHCAEGEKIKAILETLKVL